MFALRAKNTSKMRPGGRCDGNSIVIEADERAQREFFLISGVLKERKRLFRALRNLQNFSKYFLKIKNLEQFYKKLQNFLKNVQNFANPDSKIL